MAAASCWGQAWASFGSCCVERFDLHRHAKPPVWKQPMTLLTSRSEFVTEILAALGLKPEDVALLDLRIRPGEPVTASALVYVPGTIITKLKRFELSAKPISPDAIQPEPGDGN